MLNYQPQIASLTAGVVIGLLTADLSLIDGLQVGCRVLLGPYVLVSEARCRREGRGSIGLPIFAGEQVRREGGNRDLRI